MSPKPNCSVCKQFLTDEEHEKERHDFFECLIDQYKCTQCYKQIAEQQRIDDIMSYTMCGG